MYADRDGKRRSADALMDDVIGCPCHDCGKEDTPFDCWQKAHSK